MTSTVLYDPFFVGFEKFLEEIKSGSTGSFPAYNIVKHSETNYVIELALAGYAKNDIAISIEDGILVVAGRKNSEDKTNYMYKGIASRSFTRRFRIARTIKVSKAKFVDGILSIELAGESEKKSAQHISIE